MINRKYIKTMLGVYSCNYKKNDTCNKSYCICNGGECKMTTQYKYAKKTLLNYIKKIINNIKK